MLDWKKAKFMSHKGTSKWFSKVKGFGFIISDEGQGEGEGDIFTHYTAISMDRYKTLRAAQAVSYGPSGAIKGS